MELAGKIIKWFKRILRHERAPELPIHTGKVRDHENFPLMAWFVREIEKARTQDGLGPKATEERFAEMSRRDEDRYARFKHAEEIEALWGEAENDPRFRELDYYEKLDFLERQWQLNNPEKKEPNDTESHN